MGTLLRPSTNFIRCVASRRLCTQGTSTQPRPPARPSHSTDEASSSKSYEAEVKSEAKVAILQQAVMRQVRSHGFTNAAVEAAVAELKWSPAAVGMLPQGIATVSAAHEMDCNRRLAEFLRDEDSSMQDEDKVSNDAPARAANAMRHRLTMLDDVHPFWYQAIALRSRTATNSLHARLLLIDEIAAYASYSHPQVSWYSDRAVIGAVYQAAELYWLTDTSSGRCDTMHFVETRMRNAHDLRHGLSSSYRRVMNLSDMLTSTLSTIHRSSRSSY